MNLSKVVLALREHAKATQAEVAESVGVTAQAVNLWEHGGSVGPFNRQKLLAYARKVAAPSELIAKLEAAQPEIRV